MKCKNCGKPAMVDLKGKSKGICLKCFNFKNKAKAEEKDKQHEAEIKQIFDKISESSLSSNWDMKKFRIKCMKCESIDVDIKIQEKEWCEGSELTGCWISKDEGILVKCWNCGHAMLIGEIDGE